MCIKDSSFKKQRNPIIEKAINKNKETKKEDIDFNESTLKELTSILVGRERVKTEDYGPFNDNVAKCARIASELCMKEFTTEDAFKFLMALKLSRLAYNHKHDTYMDLAAYTIQADSFMNEQKK